MSEILHCVALYANINIDDALAYVDLHDRQVFEEH